MVKMKPLPPVNPDAPTVTDQDGTRQAIVDAIDHIINGAGSYYPDGRKIRPDIIQKNLQSFIGKLQIFQGTVHDPTGQLNEVVQRAKKLNDVYRDYVEKNVKNELPGGPVIIPPELDPGILIEPTRDGDFPTPPRLTPVDLPADPSSDPPSDWPLTAETEDGRSFWERLFPGRTSLRLAPGNWRE
ncbi:hypothetical protein [Sinorhizobium saheli]|uniref:hypothetical protein n=1 Tax=Sinorhizobium saheli TaxID=36856 RepID=UPI001294A278|nr:hypothetical protein [Sinorhizobium saheli]MQW89878.1 hypothetical protein [Sinorhizobium saheli]